MKHIEVKSYIEAKVAHGVNLFAFSTADGYIAFIKPENLLDKLERFEDDLLKVHNGVHIAKLTYKGVRKPSRMAFFKACDIIAHVGDIEGWVTTENTVARLIDGQRIGGLNNHHADAVSKIHGLKVEVKAVGGWMDGSSADDDE